MLEGNDLIVKSTIESFFNEAPEPRHGLRFHLLGWSSEAIYFETAKERDAFKEHLKRLLGWGKEDE